LEAFGIKEFTEKLQDERTHGIRVVTISYVSLVNKFSVFMLVNCFWVIALVLLANFPTGLAVILFPFGFFLWRLTVKILELLSKSTRKLAPRYRQGEGWLKWTIVILPLLLWAIIYGAVGLIHIMVHFGVDLPLRFTAEKLLGKWLLNLFAYIKNMLDKEHRTRLKVHSLLGVVFLISGFIYQILGITLTMLV